MQARSSRLTKPAKDSGKQIDFFYCTKALIFFIDMVLDKLDLRYI
jgi:hypothetical protein